MSEEYNVEEPIDEDEAIPSSAANASETTDDTVERVETVQNGDLKLSGGSQKVMNSIAEFKLESDAGQTIVNADKSPEFINACSNLMNAAQVKMPEPMQLVAIQNSWTLSDAKKVLESVPENVWPTAIPCTVILVGILAYSPGFIWLLITIGVCICLSLFLSSWTATKTVNTRTELEVQRNAYASKFQEVNVQAVNQMAVTAKSLYQLKLDGITNIENIRADVQKNQFATAKAIHEMQVKGDCQLKEMEENGMIERTKMENNTKVLISQNELEVEKEVSKIKSETEKEKQKILQDMHNATLTTEIKKKNIENKTATEVAKIEKEKLLAATEAKNRMEERRLQAETQRQMENQRAETERHNKQIEMERSKIERESQMKIKTEEEITNRVRIEEDGKTNRSRKGGCIIC